MQEGTKAVPCDIQYPRARPCIRRLKPGFIPSLPHFAAGAAPGTAWTAVRQAAAEVLTVWGSSIIRALFPHRLAPAPGARPQTDVV